MKREIKFRMWSHNTKFMYADTGITSLGLNDAINKATDVGYELMQFTGLKDKNGKEIYEGDIVRFKISSSREEPLLTHLCFPVTFSDGMFCLEIPEGDYPLDAYLHQEAEVIGNIYENPELLNQ